jgi:hypothetical protein
MGDR